MDLMNIIVCAVIGIILLVVVIGVVMGVLFCGDIASYTATGSETLSPTGASIGNAMVVYNPGLSGAAKDAAKQIAGDLQVKGYTVTLAGIKSSAAANTSGYDVIVAGGPMYFGRVSNSVDAYLNGLKALGSVKIGAFATTGSAQFNDGDIASFGKQVAADLNRTAVAQTIRNGNATGGDCLAFVAAVA